METLTNDIHFRIVFEDERAVSLGNSASQILSTKQTGNCYNFPLNCTWNKIIFLILYQ